MAQYHITFGCGHEGVVYLTGKGSDRERKIEYFKEYGLCKECYKKKMEDQAETEGFHFNATVLPDIDPKDGSIQLRVWFSGNTKPHKDAIKDLGGYIWGERMAANDYFSTSKPPMCWSKVIKFDDLPEETVKAASIGAESLISDAGLFAMANYQIAVKQHERWLEMQDKLSAIEKPEVPSIIADHKWNQTIYGKSGNYNIYLDGEKTFISDEQADELRMYLESKEAYNAKIREVKKEYQ